MDIDRRTFEALTSLVHEKCGISLGEGKEALVGARLGKRLRALGMDDARAYLDWVKGAGGENELVHLLDAISTNVTSFYREPAHFEFIRDTFRGWLAQGQRRFRFWSAASSSGEEPYTLAMTLLECAPPAGSDVRILATDISTKVLDIAAQGEYPENRLESLPPGYVERYFVRDAARGPVRRIRDELGRMILFKRLNLAFPPFPMQGPMDAIFIRNVMIYFDTEARRKLVAEAWRLLKPGGFLLVGHSENLAGIAQGFRCVKPSVYAKERG